MIDRRSFVTLLVGGTALTAMGTLPLPAFASIETEAETFLTDLGNRAIAELTNSGLDDAARRDRFRQLMVEYVDFPTISQQVLGKYWRSASDADRADFTVVLRETLIARFAPLFKRYDGQTFTVTSTRVSAKDASVVAATTKVLAPNGNVANVEWYMKKSADGLRVYDFSAEGIRLTTSLKEEYASVVRRADGDLRVLIEGMKDKLSDTARLDQAG